MPVLDGTYSAELILSVLGHKVLLLSDNAPAPIGYFQVFSINSVKSENLTTFGKCYQITFTE